MATVILFFIAVVPACTVPEHAQALEFTRSEYTILVDNELSPVNRYREFRVVKSVDHLSAYWTENAVDHVRLNEGWFAVETAPGKPLSVEPMRRDEGSVQILTECFRQAGIAGVTMDYVLPTDVAQGARETVIVFQIDRLDRPVEGLTEETLLNERRLFGEGFAWVREGKCAVFDGSPRVLDPETQTYSRVLWDVFDLAGNTYLVFDTVWYELEKLEVFVVVEGAKIREIGGIEIRGN